MAAALAAAVLAPGARARLSSGFGAVSDFVHGGGETPGPSIDAVPRPGWVDNLPGVRGNGPAPPNSHVLASSPGGERLLAYRDVGDESRVCFLYGSFGGECRLPSDPLWRDLLTPKRIGLLARSRNADGVVALWGVVGDEVSAVRVLYSGGQTQTLPVQYGFVATGDRSAPPVALEALDADGNVLGRVSASAPNVTDCDPSGCSVPIQASG